MFIFIRESEHSDMNNLYLSNTGFVRRNHLSHFFINKKNPKINIPEKIVCMTQKQSSFQSVIMLSIDLNIKVHEFDDINNLVDFLIENKDNDILICWKYDEIHKIAENLIYKLFKTKIKLCWGKNPLNKKQQENEYSIIWVLNNNKFQVFPLYNVIYNEIRYCYDISYSQFTIHPIFTKQFTTSFIYNILNKLKFF